VNLRIGNNSGSSSALIAATPDKESGVVLSTPGMTGGSNRAASRLRSSRLCAELKGRLSNASARWAVAERGLDAALVSGCSSVAAPHSSGVACRVLERRPERCMHQSTRSLCRLSRSAAAALAVGMPIGHTDSQQIEGETQCTPQRPGAADAPPADCSP
jgi:hypothetical protein